MELKDLKEKHGYILISDINISKDGDYCTLKEGSIINCDSIVNDGFITYYFFSYIKKGDGKELWNTDTMSFTDISIDSLLKVIKPQAINEDKPNDIKKELKIKDLELNVEYKVLVDVTILTNNEGYFVLTQGELVQLVGIYHINDTFEFQLYSCRFRENRLIGRIVVTKKQLELTLLPFLNPKETINKPQEKIPTTPVIKNNELDYHKIYNIPSEIRLASTKIKVLFKELNNNLSEEALMIDEVHFGNATYITNTIELQIPRFKVIQYDVKHTYYHELLHWIFYIMGKTSLNDDEGFIDLVSNLLSQAMENN